MHVTHEPSILNGLACHDSLSVAQCLEHPASMYVEGHGL